MKCIANNSLFLAGFSIMWITIHTIFMQFIYFDSQYRSVNPQHYNVDVITQEDYKQLSNSENRSVKLSTGKTVTGRTQAWYSDVLPKYKSVNDGSQYVLVTLRGTAPFMHQWYSGVLPICGIKGRRIVKKELDITASQES